MDRILKLLKEIREDADFTKSTNFVEDHLLDSLDLMNLVGSIESDFNIRIKNEDIVKNNFSSLEALKLMILNNGGDI